MTLIGTPFLTQLDPRARIKGSVDPLGFVAVWTRLGRLIIRNLTTVTTSVRGFTTLLLGLYFSEQMSDGLSPADDQYVAAFLRFEQLAAYSRVARSAYQDAYDEDEIRGIQRVRSNLNSENGRVRISAENRHQILANQKMYGLWGLYMVAARNSNWLEPSLPQLKPEARNFIERACLPQLGRQGDTLYYYLERDSALFEPRGRDVRLAKCLADALVLPLRAEEREFYERHLLAGGEPDSLQAKLWNCLRAVNRAGSFDRAEPVSYSEIQEVIRRAEVAGQTQLAHRLEQIRRVEDVISPAAHVFRFMLARDGRPVRAVAAEVRTAWGGKLKHVAPAAFADALAVTGDALSAEIRTRLCGAAEALAEGDYGRLLLLLLDHNREVMQARGGQPWVRLQQDRLDVRYQDEISELPPRETLPDLWHPYFLNSLKRVGYQIEGV